MPSNKNTYTIEEASNYKIEIQRMVQRGCSQEEISEKLGIAYDNITIIEYEASTHNRDSYIENYNRIPKAKRNKYKSILPKNKQIKQG